MLEEYHIFLMRLIKLQPPLPPLSTTAGMSTFPNLSPSLSSLYVARIESAYFKLIGESWVSFSVSLFPGGGSLE
jgi:hypothetical protein